MVGCLTARRYLLASDAEASKGLSAFETGASPETESRLAEVLVHACSSELASLGGCNGLMIGKRTLLHAGKDACACLWQ